MQGSLTICAVMGALGLVACGSPSELDDGAFPSLDKTGYVAPGSSGTTQVAPAGQAGSGAAVSSGGSSGSLANASGGGMQTGTVPSTGAGAGGSAGTSAAGSAGTNGAGNAGTNGVGTGGTNAAGPPASNGCPPDITVLFARPIAQGGCTSGGGCHEATSAIKPDLVSPNVAARLLNVASSCSKTSSGMSVQPRPYIGKDDSFLEEKISGTVDSSCGISMPFFMPDALSAADEQCIIQWIDQVAGG